MNSLYRLNNFGKAVAIYTYKVKQHLSQSTEEEAGLFDFLATCNAKINEPWEDERYVTIGRTKNGSDIILTMSHIETVNMPHWFKKQTL